MITQRPMEEVVNENFRRYAGNVILDRAICDVRDMLKPSARMLIYSQLSISKNVHSKPFIKSARVVGDCLGHLYEHGDASCYGSYMRMSKSFAMRVPLEDCQGNNGTMAKNGDEAAMRYTELRLSEIAGYLCEGLNKNAIGNQWRDNFNETEQYPGVMPSIGYFNICNGTQGLGIAISSSIPQFRLKEVNDAIIKLIRDPNAPDKDIILMPDFATGGLLMNPKEVYESLKYGTGAACKLRAVMNYNPDTQTILVTELPYGVYSETVKKEVQAMMLEDEKCGIKMIHDNTGKTPEIEIVLEKGVNYKKMLSRLYKETSLETHFTINMWVLENGRFPKIMGLREIFQNYIEHVRECERNILRYDLDKALAKQNVLKGLIKACSIIEEIIALIRASNSPAEASTKLIATYGFNEEQAKAILAMKLSNLTKLDIVKLNDDLKEIVEKIQSLTHLLNTPHDLDEEIIKKLQEVANKFDDARRTKIMNMTIVEDDEKVEIKEEELGILLFDNNTIRAIVVDNLQGGKRGRKGVNIKPPKNANLINTLYTTNLGTVSVITNKGRMYQFTLNDLEYEKDYSVYELIEMQDGEIPILLMDSTSFNAYKNLVTISKNGYIKKSSITEYATARTKRGVVAAKLDDDDTLVGVYLSSSDEDKVFIVSSAGYYNYYAVSNINATGRATRGVKAIKLEDGEYVISATIIKQGLNYRGMLTIASNGQGKITPLDEFNTTSRGIKGNQVMNIKDNKIAAASAITEDKEKIYVAAAGKAVIVDVSSIPVQSRVTAGIKIIGTTSEKIEII